MTPAHGSFALIFAQHGLSQYVRHHFLDTTFKGLYHANAFDMALLMPYFFVLILLATYGIHRYALYFFISKNKKNRLPNLPRKFSNLHRSRFNFPFSINMFWFNGWFN